MTGIPSGVLKIMDTVKRHGGEVYAVGGCVRDLLLGREIHDWDLCGSLLPEKVTEIFPHTVPTGIRHGTVTVILDGTPYELTTFRSDGSYSDHRKPDSVSFSSELKEDLARRDFTVNAMAMDASGSIIDLFGGREDLKKGILRCVGDPEKRFMEDALRIFRAVRFSAQLSFEISEETRRAMERCKPYCKYLSAERIREETEKILLSPHPESIGELSDVLHRFGWSGKADYTALSELPPEREIRIAGLLRLEPEADLRAMRFENRTIRICTAAIRCERLTDAVSVKRMIFLYGEAAARTAAFLQGEIARFRSVIESEDCIRMQELAVCGNDFPTVTGKALGILLNDLLAYVWEHPDANKKEELLHIAKKRFSF